MSSVTSSRPLRQSEDSIEEMQARIADLEEKLAQADRIIVSALATSVSLGDMSKKLQSAHAALKDALTSRGKRVA